jgi:hypothetical protein
MTKGVRKVTITTKDDNKKFAVFGRNDLKTVFGLVYNLDPGTFEE